MGFPNIVAYIGIIIVSYIGTIIIKLKQQKKIKATRDFYNEKMGTSSQMSLSYKMWSEL